MVLIKKYIKLFKINRFFFKRLSHIILNIFPLYVQCLVCNWRGTKFFNGYCPICFSQARHRLLAYIQKIIILEPVRKILLIGPGPIEIILFKLFSNSRTKILNVKQTDFTDIVCDVTENKIKLNNYDLIIMWHVLEHIVEDQKAVENVFNMLKNGGIFLFSVPIYPLGNKETYTPKYSSLEDKIHKTGHPDHCICCGYDYPDRFTNLGFTKLTTISVRDFDQDITSKYGLSMNHIAWIYKK